MNKKELLLEETENNEENDELPKDSLTLLQLRKILSDVHEKNTLRYDFVYTDTDTLENELEEWYDGCNINIIQGKIFFKSFFREKWVNYEIKKKKKIICHCLNNLNSNNAKERVKSFVILFYLSQGNYGETKNQQNQMHWIFENNKIMNECGALRILYDSIRECIDSLNTYKTIIVEGSDVVKMNKLELLKMELNCKMTSFYFLLETLRSNLEFRKDVANLFPPIISWIIEKIANLRDDFNIWKLYFPIIQTVQILWKLVLCVLGNTNDLLCTKQYVRMLAGLSPKLDKKDIIATPLDYHIFRQYIVSKYPSYDPPPTLLNIDLNYTTLLPINTKESATKEIQDRVCPSTADYSATPLPSPYSSPKKKQLTSLVLHLESFVSVIIEFLNFLIDEEQNYIKKNIDEKETKKDFDSFSPERILHIRKREIASKSISSTLLLLLKWFKQSHVLKFEFLSRIILDSNYINTFNKLFSIYDPVESISHISEIPCFSYFNTCNMQSENPNKNSNIVCNLSKNFKTKNKEDKENKEDISNFSWRNLFSLVNHLRILQKLTKKKTHRILMLIQKKTWIHLQKLTKITNDIVLLYTLKLFKGQIPYYNRKWKQNNMKIITSIYLYCKPELQDDWVSSIEVDTNTEESLEYALRSLISFYNFYHYSLPSQSNNTDVKNSNISNA
ncbi:hypothetical protein PORY_001074 [Pneumocystis oryctolagi]|uniref:Uncharacterized protein n=1 Tax=Pneumocystis oryctolagi TaxID=42067 RepID=A0ACB7CD62_9ASCO|nr:hypothetical protein PORY_001074 [Pneumocystis oryctolagi]